MITRTEITARKILSENQKMVLKKKKEIYMIFVFIKKKLYVVWKPRSEKRWLSPRIQASWTQSMIMCFFCFAQERWFIKPNWWYSISVSGSGGYRSMALCLRNGLFYLSVRLDKFMWSENRVDFYMIVQHEAEMNYPWTTWPAKQKCWFHRLPY